MPAVHVRGIVGIVPQAQLSSRGSEGRARLTIRNVVGPYLATFLEINKTKLPARILYIIN